MQDSWGRHQTALVVLVAILCLGLFSLTFRSSGVVFDLPLTEDGYYVQTVARNVARGVGLSADGTTWTNGFHPLWVILSAGAFFVADDSSELAIRVILAASAVLTILSALLWSSIAAGAFDAGNRLYRIIFVLIYLTSFQLLAQHFNGLETGFVLFLIAAIGIYWCSSSDRDRPVTRSAILGVLLGLLVLARIDAGIFAVLVGLDVIWRLRRDLGQVVVQLLVMGGLAAVISGPWFVYNLAMTGRLVPVSGLALALEGSTNVFGRAYIAVGALARDGFPIIVGEINRPISLALFVVACATAILLLLRRSADLPPSLRDPAMVTADAATFRLRCRTYMTLVAVYLGIQVVVYSAWNAAPFFYQRYFILLSVLAVGAFSYLLYRLATSSMVWLASAIAVLLTGGAITTILGWHGMPLGVSLNNLQKWHNGPNLGQVELTERVRRSGEKVGALQTGTLGFFVEGTINLDGRVNLAAYNARREGKLLDYVLDQGIGLLVDFDNYLQPGNFRYFPADNDVGRYFRRVAPDHPPQEYDWVALRRTLGQTSR